MPLSNRQRQALQQMGITLWQRREQSEASVEPARLKESSNQPLFLLLLTPSKPQGRWLDDFLMGLQISPEAVAWLPAPQLSAELLSQWQPHLCLALGEPSALATINCPAPQQWLSSAAAKRRLWQQLQPFIHA